LPERKGQDLVSKNQGEWGGKQGKKEDFGLFVTGEGKRLKRIRIRVQQREKKTCTSEQDDRKRGDAGRRLQKECTDAGRGGGGLEVSYYSQKIRDNEREKRRYMIK